MRIAAIDQGTTSTRCLVIEDGGDWRVADTRRHRQVHPAPGWVEHDPEELLLNVEKVSAAAGPVDAIALSNQGESCLAWDAVTGKPLSPVIVWQDSRTASALATYSPSAQVRSRKVCGLPLDPYFSASKLSWLIKHIPAVSSALVAKRLRLGTTDAFFLTRLSGSFVTDIATASRTGLLDMGSGTWSAEMCELHGVPIQCLPKITSVDAGFGKIGNTPIRVSIVDQQAALYGHNCRKPGDCKITFGTGAFLLAVAGGERPETADLLPTIAWQRVGEEPTFALEGGVYDAGAALDWAQRIGLYSHVDELDGFDGPSALSRGIAFVPALSGLAAPYWDRAAGSLFIGMNHATDRRDLVRAVIEGIAMLTATVIAAASEVMALSPTISIDGGLSQSAYFARFLAAATNRIITVPPVYELTALGLAELCGVNIDGLRAPARHFAPDGFVTDDDNNTFTNAVRRARAWKR